MTICNLFVLVLTALSGTSSFGRCINTQYFSTDDSLKIVEKVYLHVDRDSYHPGDDIWFKAYLIDASSRLLSNHSNNLHVELISPALKIIDNRVVRLNEGVGNGDFLLPENLKSGQYRLRAYTNYMRNYSDQLFFNKDITIINSSDAVKTFSDSIKYIKNKLEINFFPEGGSLVDNVSSIVAFKAVNALGGGCDVSGEIYSSTGEIVTTFKSIHKGMGTFTLNPVPGLNYYALAKNLYGDVIKSEIPKSFSTGIVLSISKNQSNELLVIFKTNTETFPLVLNHDLSLTISACNIAFKTINIRMKSLNNFFILPTGDLPDGIVMLTLSGLDNIPLCERLVYIQNNEDIKLNLETNKTVYNQRDSVSVKISLSENSGIVQEAFLSLSATEKIYTNNSSQFSSTISSWFLLESDVRGSVEEPSYYFDPSNPNRLIKLDLLLLTQGWRDFEWKYKNMNYPPETGFKVSGRLRKLFADVPLKDPKVNIGIFTSGNPVISTVPTDSSGRFYLEGVDLTGEAKLIASAIGEKENLEGWLLLDSLSYSPAKVEDNIAQTKLLLNDNQPINDNQLIKENLNALIQYAEIKNTIRKKYKLSDTINLPEVKVIAKRLDDPESAIARSRRYLLGTPDASLIVTPQLEIYSNAFNLMRAKLSFFGAHCKNPLLMINGMKVGFDALDGLPVSFIERIDVSDKIDSYAVFGAGIGDKPIDGVISIITREGAPLITYSHVYHSANIKFSGYNEPRIFYSPKHSSDLKPDYKPDLRTTIFWEPNIRVENNKYLFLNYFNADNSSIIKVIVEGITTTGIPVTGKTEYEVKQALH